MTDKEFETYWKENRMTILDKNDEYRHAKENFKIHSGADLILFGKIGRASCRERV